MINPPQTPRLSPLFGKADRPRVAVLGCGPAGLMAAAGAVNAGVSRIDIFSKRRKSEMFGAQYLHEPIPLYTDQSYPPVQVRYQLQGDVQKYRLKVYGEGRNFQVSPEALEKTHPAWDIRSTYDRLWKSFLPYIKDCNINDVWLQQLLDSDDYDMVISSLPAPALCRMHPAPEDAAEKGLQLSIYDDGNPHSFDMQQVWAIGDAPERGVFAPYTACPEDTVICNGNAHTAWYRVSKIYGYTTQEWPYGTRPPVKGAALITKPISNNCTCFSDVLRVGRYGEWTKGVLSHTAYTRAADAVKSRAAQ